MLAVQSVPVYFDARFHCLYRAYKYFFYIEPDMDLRAMELAAQAFVGEHDYRNFCKIDPTVQKSFRRRVLHFTLGLESSDVGVFNVVGPAFLWHQVRCMVGLIMLIGKGVKPISTVSLWLDLDRTPKKPG